MKEFAFRISTRILYGEGAVKKIGEECKKLKFKKVFFITDPFMTKHSPTFPQLISLIKDAGLDVEVYSDVEADPSIETIDKVASIMKVFGGDVVVALGGGSPMDTAKSISILQTNEGSIRDYLYKVRTFQHDALPIICIPTTAGTGSEVTAGAVTTDRQTEEKIGVNHASIMPKLAIIDPEIMVSMPPALTAATGMDALCHAIEAYVSTEAEPISDALCLHAIRLIGENLRKAVSNGRDIKTRGNMALASVMAGIGFAQAGLGLVHAIAHCLGAMYRVPHGVANALMLPFVMEFNAMASMERFRDIAIALGEDVSKMSLRDAAYQSVEAVKRLKSDIGIPPTLSEVGVKEKDLPTIVEHSITYRLLPYNPRTVTPNDINSILWQALK
jgi:alcohol dehydrogenase class IV